MLAFQIRNMNAQGKLFRADMRPVYRVLPSKPAWARLPLAASHTGTKEDDDFVLRFRHKCEGGPRELMPKADSGSCVVNRPHRWAPGRLSYASARGPSAASDGRSVER